MKCYKEKYKTVYSTDMYDDEYYEDNYDVYYENDHLNYLYPDDLFNYVYIAALDTFTPKIERVRVYYNNYDSEGCEMYVGEDNLVYPIVFTYSHVKKLDAFFGCVMKVMKYSDEVSDRVKRIYGTLVEKYPDIHFKLLGKFED